MKVYIVIETDDDWHPIDTIDKVFRSKKKAEEYESYMNSRKRNYIYTMEEHEVE